MDVTNIQKSIDKIITGLVEMKEFFYELSGANPAEFKAMSIPGQAGSAGAAASIADEEFDTFDKLVKALQSDRWPEAVNKNLICDPENELDKVERGKGVVELMVEENLQGLKFLDYGCGEGHSVWYAAEKEAAMSVGYDTEKYEKWTTFAERDNRMFVNDFDTVRQNGPYDVILLFDVIDHLYGEDPVEVLKKLESVLSDTGKIYMRTHPFTSRHATHLYHDNNKAYLHLVFTPQEMAQLVPASKYAEHNVGVKYPVMTYNEYCTKAKLKIISKREIKEAVEPFFQIPKIAGRIMKNLKMNSFPDFQMSIQFIDYVLGKESAPIKILKTEEPKEEPQSSNPFATNDKK